MENLTPRTINVRYEELRSIISNYTTQEDQNKAIDTFNLRDYNKIVEQLHIDAYQDAQMSKLIKIEKLAEKQRRKELKLLKRKEKEDKLIKRLLSGQEKDSIQTEEQQSMNEPKK